MMTPLLQPVISPILVGRDECLVALDMLAARVRAGNGVTLLVSGEAGIGKSRLVAEARTRFANERGSRVLQGNCFEHDVGLPYAPVVDLLRGLMDRRPDDLAALLVVAPELVVLLPELAGQPGQRAPIQIDPEQDKRRMQEAFQRSIATLASDQPLLVVIEDIHWADDLSLELLQRLALRATGQPLLLIVTWRDDEVSERLSHFLAAIDRARVGTELRLERLTTLEIETMLQTIFDQPQPIRPDFLQTIAGLTDGNPFFIEEVLSALIAAGDIYRAHGAWARKEVTELRVPRSVLDAVQQRRRWLSGPARQILDLAAVAGQRFDVDVVRELAGVDETGLLRLLRELIDARLIVEISAQQFAFRHALTREAVYTGLLARERHALHLSIAGTIERLYAEMVDPWIADLSYHYHAAKAWLKAFEYAQRAGERAQALYAPQAAIEHFSRALDVAHHLPGTPTLHLYRQRGTAHETLGGFESAQSDYQTALDMARAADDRNAEWQALIDLGVLWSGRDYARGGDYYERAYVVARAIDELPSLAHSLNRVGNWYLRIERPLDARRHHQEALTIFQRLGDRRGMAETLNLLGMACHVSGDLAHGTDYFRQAVDLLHELNNRQGLVFSLATLSVRGAAYHSDIVIPAVVNLGEAARDGESAVEMARQIGWRAGEAYALARLGCCLGAQGDYQRALDAARQGLAIAEEIDHRQWMAAASCGLGALYLDLLAPAEARGHLERARALGHEIGSLYWLRVAAGHLALTFILDGQLDSAEAIIDEALTPDTPRETLAQRLAWSVRAQLALARGDPSRTLRIADELLASAAHGDSQTDAVIPRLWMLRAEALVALRRISEAVSVLAAALETAREQGAQPILWRLQLALGTVYQLSGRDEEAEREFEAATATVEQLAAGLPDESLGSSFLSHATALIPCYRQQPTRRTHDALTAREQEVAMLVARGQSNREIAEALFVGERTIETHVGNILGKRGFSSRVQIAAWVVETGLTNH